MTLRARLVLLVVAVTIVSLGGAFAAVAAVVNRSELAQLDAAVRAEAIEEAHRVSGGEILADAQQHAATRGRGLTLRLAAIYQADGSIIDASRTFQSRPPPLELVDHPNDVLFDVALRGEPTRATIVAIPGRPSARLLFAAPRHEVDAEAAFMRRAMVVAFLVAVIWAGLVASWVVSRLTRDNDAIAGVVRRVAAGDLTARVGRRGADGDTARLAADVDEMVARLEVLVGSQQRFIAHAAHELRSPLTTLYGELQLALRKSRDAAAYREAIREALDSTERLRSLSEDLLALARAGAEDDADHVLVPMGEVAQRVVDGARSRAAERGVAVKVAVDAAAITRGRRPDLERLVQNLVDNAIRHSPAARTVHVCARGAGDDLEVEVTDEGEGVPPDARERIFEPFFRLPRDRGLNGAGLGLAIAREIARAHGGDLRLAAGGSGARFVLRLPRASLPAE